MGAKTTRQIAEFVCRIRYEDLPSEVVDYSKVLALSHLGMTIAGSTLDCGRKITGYIKAKGGNPEAGVLGAGFRTSADYAALANGNSAKTTELEDDSHPEVMYSCGHWPTVFAMGEKLKVPGANLILALAVGYEVAARLGLAFPTALERGWGSFAALSAIGNAATAAKLLGLTVEQTTSALSLAASQAAGIRRQGGSGAHFAQAGFTGRNGICAAELAALGYTGQPDILEGKGGFGDLWAGCPEFDLPLGEGYRLMRVGIKKYSCAYRMQRNIDGVLDLIAEHGIAWDEVASIVHGINNFMKSTSCKFDQPETAEQTRYSLQHCTVACFFDEKIFLPTFTAEKALDPRWREARSKVKVTVNPEWPDALFSFDSPVTINLKNGKVLQKMCHRARGDPDLRFGPDEVMKKYRDCMDFAGTFSRARTEQVAEMTLALDKMEDVSVLATLLTFPDRA